MLSLGYSTDEMDSARYTGAGRGLEEEESDETRRKESDEITWEEMINEKGNRETRADER